ncbi:hypothetical protein K0U00_47695, partial [Paenibacillus sepulcri]|nr:hypothetical protein [Paenibacillus sepulcri]
MIANSYSLCCIEHTFFDKGFSSMNNELVVENNRADKKGREGNQMQKSTTEDFSSSENMKNVVGFSEKGLRRMREVLARHVESGKIPGL